MFTSEYIYDSNNNNIIYNNLFLGYINDTVFSTITAISGEATFSDGSTAESCDEHLWTVRFTDLHKDYREYTLSQIQEKMDKGYSPRVYPITKVDSPSSLIGFSNENGSFEPRIKSAILLTGIFNFSDK